MSSKECIQFLFKSLCSTRQFNQPFDVVRNIPEILPGISFRKRITSVCTVFIRIERFHPFSLIILRLEETSCRIEKIPVEFRTLVESLVVGVFFQFCSQLSNTPIIKSLFQCNGNRLSLNIFGHITILLPYFKRRIKMRSDRTVVYCLISLFHINSRDTFQNGIRNNRDGVIANHAVIVLSP